jgi:hypothetical protein
MKCNKCEKEFTVKDRMFYDRRYCWGTDKEGKTGFGLFCTKCEPVPKLLEHIH